MFACLTSTFVDSITAGLIERMNIATAFAEKRTGLPCTIIQNIVKESRGTATLSINIVLA
jgi:hypothetical protein